MCLFCGYCFFFFFQAEDGIRDGHVTGVQTCALPIVMANVRKEGPLGLGPLHNAQGILHGRVRRMRLVTECIEKQDVQVLELGEGSLWYIAVVRKISRGAEAVAVDLSIPVYHCDGLETCPEQLNHAVDRL